MHRSVVVLPAVTISFRTALRVCWTPFSAITADQQRRMPCCPAVPPLMSAITRQLPLPISSPTSGGKVPLGSSTERSTSVLLKFKPPLPRLIYGSSIQKRQLLPMVKSMSFRKTGNGSMNGAATGWKSGSVRRWQSARESVPSI